MYYLMEFGYYIHSLGNLMYEPKMADFWQMVIHHTTTLLLILFSYFVGYTRVGVTLMLVRVAFLLAALIHVGGYLCSYMTCQTPSCKLPSCFCTVAVSWEPMCSLPFLPWSSLALDACCTQPGSCTQHGTSRRHQTRV